ncbi:hypothetical protein NE237_028214 [Protea cynaroides]|uniref:Uncharacterized protein n=1 Tax=Protea cynaroides TaxID=273540 RepID=A0A9Q0GNX1_9MAGN|nr:hypothetical protein NE237_028214 [Protea cynaroides]
MGGKVTTPSRADLEYNPHSLSTHELNCNPTLTLKLGLGQLLHYVRMFVREDKEKIKVTIGNNYCQDVYCSHSLAMFTVGKKTNSLPSSSATPAAAAPVTGSWTKLSIHSKGL